IPAIAPNQPVIFDNCIHPSDVCQGLVGNDWLCGQLSALATSPTHVAQAIYPQVINPAGLYGVRLYRRGKWYWVLVDDQFPMPDNGFPFIRSKNPNEFWASIIEKALAKINGSWQGLSFGLNIGMEPISVLTGARCYTHLEEGTADTLFNWLGVLFSRGAWVSASTGCEDEGVSMHGLLPDQEYTALGTFHHQETGIKLVKLRNTWGSHGEWKGPWSDGSAEWTQFPFVQECTRHQFTDDDGTFFLPHTAFSQFFGWFKAFPRPDGVWPPTDLPYPVPSSLKEPLEEEFCYGDDYDAEELEGMEGDEDGSYYPVLSEVVVAMPDVPEDMESAPLFPHNAPQYSFVLDEDTDLKIRVCDKPQDLDGDGVEDEQESYAPWYNIFSVPDGLKGSHMRRMDGTEFLTMMEEDEEAEMPEGYMGSYHSGYWLETSLEAGKYLICVGHDDQCGKPLMLQCKASKTIKFRRIPSGSRETAMACTSEDNMGEGDYENSVQYSFVVEEGEEIMVAAAYQGDMVEDDEYQYCIRVVKDEEEAYEVRDGDFFESAEEVYESQEDSPYPSVTFWAEPGQYIIQTWHTPGEEEDVEFSVAGHSKNFDMEEGEGVMDLYEM
ncbi:peptidase C2, calpain family, partial [Kipferlia bialata]